MLHTGLSKSLRATTTRSLLQMRAFLSAYPQLELELRTTGLSGSRKSRKLRNGEDISVRIFNSSKTHLFSSFFLLSKQKAWYLVYYMV